MAELSALLDTLNVPSCAPIPAGTKLTPTVQFAPTAKVFPQVLFASWNPVETDNFRSVKIGPEFAFTMVSVTGLLGVPTPVAGKFTWAGTICTTSDAGGSRPVPFRATVWGVLRRISAIVRVPVCGPDCVGVKTTLMAQLELEASIAVQGLAEI